MPSISQLEYALAVEKHLHFGKAARDCHVTQPTLSMQLQKLEDELGVALFDRSKKPILITDAGKNILEQARVVLREYKQMVSLASRRGDDVSGDFRLAIIPTLSPYLLPLFLGSFARQYPKVNLRIEEMQTDRIVAALEQDDIDAGLLVTPLNHAQLIEHALFYEPFLVYAPKDHKLAKQRSQKVAETDLEASDVWLLDEGHCLRNQVVRLCGRRKENAALANVRFTGGSIETLKRLVETTGGYTLVPYLAAAKNNSTAVLREFTRPIPAREISLVFRRQVYKLPIVEALEDSILAAIPAELRKIRKKDLEVVAIS